MKNYIIIILMLLGLSTKAQVKKTTLYSNQLYKIWVHKFDSLDTGGKSYVLISQDPSYKYIVSMNTIYKGSDLATFIDKAIIFVNNNEPKTSIIIDGTNVTDCRNYVRLKRINDVGSVTLSIKQLLKIRSKL